MAYQSLYRRYRSQRFDEVLGQDHVTLALRNAVREDRVAQGYLFSGPRGTGKTSTARILAKVLNCLHPVDGEPDTTCANCQSVELGQSVDWLQELDAASNNKVDDMRDLLSRVSMGTSGNRKVYILDEVHMLSTGASNALLKTLEEPPDHVIFVLATTEPKKVLPTIRSRTQHFDFKLLSADVLADHVRHVIADAGLGLGEDSVDYVVRAGAGSARDTLSALDQVAAAGGVTEFAIPVDDIVDAIGARDVGAALLAVDASVRAGRDPRILAETLIASLREAFLVAMGAPAGGLSEQAGARAAVVAQALGPASLTRALEAIGTAMVDMRQAPDTRIPLEVALVRLTRVDADGDITALAARVEQLERRLAAGGPTIPASPAPGSAAPVDAPAPGSPALGSPALGSPALGSPALGSPALGSPALGSPALGSPEPAAAAPPATPKVESPPSPSPSPSPSPEAVAPEPAPDSSSYRPDPAPAPATGAPMDRPRGAEAARAKLAQRETAATAAPAPSASTEGVGTRPSLGGVRRAREASAPGSDAPHESPPTESIAAEVTPADDPSPAGAPVAPTDPGPDAAASTPALASEVVRPPEPAPPEPAPTDPSPTDPAPAGPNPATSDAAPRTGPLDRAAITEAWDTVLGTLRGRAKALYKLGQFIDSDERTVRFALPNTAHRDRCEDKRDEVQAALRDHFGFDVPIVLVVDGDAAQAPRIPMSPGASPVAGEDPAPVDVMDDAVDMEELIDAPDSSVGGIAQLQDAFPGAELTEN